MYALVLIKYFILNLCPCMGITVFGGSSGISNVSTALPLGLIELGSPFPAELGLTLWQYLCSQN